MPTEGVPLDEGMPAVAAALLAVTVAAACAAAALVLSAPVWLTLLAVVLGPSLVVTALAAVHAGMPLRRDRQPTGSGRPGAGAGTSARLLDAQAAVERCDAAMAAHLQSPPVDDALPVDLAMAGYEARLRLARVMLAEQGTLPRELQDDLIVRFRGFEQLLRRADVR